MQTLSPRADGRDEWSTPQSVYEAICKRWELQPTLDVCASAANAKTPEFFTAADDALSQSWALPVWSSAVRVCWMNPPYSQPLMTRFIEKAIAESKGGVTTVFLLPAWPDQAWYHDLIKPYPHEFWRGRIKFDPPAGIQASSPRYGNIHGVIYDTEKRRMING